MRLTFQLRFHTRPGQSLLLTGNHELLGRDNAASAVPMEYLDEEFWRVRLLIPGSAVPKSAIVYRYILREEDGSILEDWPKGRGFNPGEFQAEDILILDSWNHPGFYENAFYTEPFREVFLRSAATEVQAAQALTPTHVFKVRAPLLQKGQTLCLLGSSAELGNWDLSRAIVLNRSPGSEWMTAELDLATANFPIEYKYGIYNVTQRKFLYYEGGANRRLINTLAAGRKTIVNDGFAVLPVDTWKGAGVAIPVFSLRSQSSFGTGEFSDLKLLTDWCHLVGLKLIQILPVNDTSATHTSADSYPYAAISAFALHPLYLNLSQVANSANQGLLREAEQERKRLNGLDHVEYAAVMDRKLELGKKLYHLQKERTFESSEYRRFFETNEQWLVPYAVFCHLRDKNGTADFNRWKEHHSCTAQEIAALASESSPAWDDVAFNYFMQYHLHLQLKEASEYAHIKGVVLKGDIPIGVYRHGADAWQQPELYRMEMQAGAPPDAFGIKGQNWSFPTYDWPRMKATGFAWWKQRFGQMGHYFDAFRIDHILGFFRIWSIPLEDVEGILGHFVPAIPVHKSEFERRGIWLGADRYTKPFITDRLLTDLFGADADVVKSQFLLASPAGNHQLKPEFASQRKIERYFEEHLPGLKNERLREGLFDLISNVILLADENNPNEHFHFRFAIETTASFQNLDLSTQQQLRELYVDYFFRRQDAFWMQEALQKLPELKRVTNMLVCGEDLGMVPACVPEVMKQLGLLSLEVQRMPKRLDREFSNPKDAPYLSVVTPSTHDMSTIRGWWKEDRAVIQKFYNQEMGLPGAAPEECEPWVNKAVILEHLTSPAMWSIFQLQDLLGMDPHLRRPNPADERINVPADAKNYWRYRMHLWLEDLLQANGLNGVLREEIARNGR